MSHYAGRVHNGKRNVTVWRPSVCLTVPSAYSPRLAKGGWGQSTFRRDNKEDRHICYQLTGVHRVQ